MKSLVSVIVPIYNVDDYLEKSINSILNQTYKKLQIILVDDGSTDSSGKMCDEFVKKDRRVEVIHKKNKGLSAARNTGLKVANGEYIVFIDGDDFIEKEMLEELYTRIFEDKSELAICNINYVDDEGNIIPDKEFKLDNKVIQEKEFWKDYHGSCRIPYVVVWNKMYKKELFEDVEFERGKIHEDEFILHKIISRCSHISVIDKKLHNYVQREGSIMSKKYSIDRLQVIEALIERILYFEGINERKYIGITINRIRVVMAEAYRKLDFADESNKRIYDKKVKQLKKLAITYKNDIKLSIKIKLLLFLYMRSAYMILEKM